MQETSSVQTGKPWKDGGLMMAMLKWIGALLVAGLVWLVGMYTEEYFRPYKKIRARIRK
jgi:hypothetical protein